MRTGSLRRSAGGAGLSLGPVDLPLCEDVSEEDVCRIISEALTMPEAAGRSFSLCPNESDEASSTLKEMRRRGYTRRDEVQLLLTGKLKEYETEPTPASAGALAEEEAAAAVMEVEASAAATAGD